jgi:ketose-bisphosphate aldolase
MMANYTKNLAYRGVEYAAWLMRFFADRADVPIVAHLDHGESFEDCQRAIELGFTSVMIDGAALPIEQNIELTQRVVAIAKPRGVGVEAEVGELQRLGADGTVVEQKHLATADDVAHMSRQTGIDMLAVGIGNAHGFYAGEPELNLELLAQLREVSAVPLVLHGSTGIPEEVVQRCISLGVVKVNVGTLIRTHYVQFTAEVIAEGKHQNHPWRVCQVVKDRIKEDIRRIIRMTGSAGRARDFGV